MNMAVFHEGERAAQARAGAHDNVEARARQYVRPYMPSQHRDFYEQLPFLVMAARDNAGRPWVTLLAGAPGFVRATSDTGLRLDATLAPGNPLAGATREGADIGLLGIELDSRRRNRVNGTLRADADGALAFETAQSFGNCPQYITERRWIPAALQPPEPETVPGTHLSREQARWIRGADTFFIGSGYRSRQDSAANGMDASHRGGPVGFVEVLNRRTLLFPDYSGNNHFNTIGNLIQDPRVALLFVDFEQGHLLHLTGTAQIDWDSPAVAQRAGAQRLVAVQIDAVAEQRNALPIRWAAPARDSLSLRVAARIKESEFITSFVLEPASGERLPPFVPGQHLPIAAPASPANAATRRTYSLSNAPRGSSYRISVKREAQGLVSRQLHDELQVGDLLSASNPAGDFQLQDTDRPAVLISAGVGITPMLSMLAQLAQPAQGERARPVVFVHGARDGSQRAFAREVAQLSAGRPWIRTAQLLSQPGPDDQLGRDYDAQGHITAERVAALHPALDGEFYLCGPIAMLSAVTDGLTALGVASEHIHFETFGPIGN